MYMITFIFTLMWVTQVFGYYTEVLSAPMPRGPSKRPQRPLRWRVTSCLQRLTPHFFGYVPYLTIWICLGHSFFSNVTGEGRTPPDFVYVIVIGQFAVFTLFGVTQLANQIDNNGPSWYFWGARMSPTLPKPTPDARIECTE